MKEYNLEPTTGLVKPARFTFDEDSQVFGGPDGQRIEELVDAAIEAGYISLEHPPGTTHELAEEGRVTEAELGAILAPFWDTADAFPPLEWEGGEEPDVDGVLY